MWASLYLHACGLHSAVLSTRFTAAQILLTSSLSSSDYTGLVLNLLPYNNGVVKPNPGRLTSQWTNSMKLPINLCSEKLVIAWVGFRAGVCGLWCLQGYSSLPPNREVQPTASWSPILWLIKSPHHTHTQPSWYFPPPSSFLPDFLPLSSQHHSLLWRLGAKRGGRDESVKLLVTENTQTPLEATQVWPFSIHITH